MQGHWAHAANMNKTAMETVNVLEAEMGRVVEPLLERWLETPLDKRGRRCPSTAVLDRACISYLRTRHPA
eukprot:3703998-Alexandrium_andersonii.AAC.1